MEILGVPMVRGIVPMMRGEGDSRSTQGGPDFDRSGTPATASVDASAQERASAGAELTDCSGLCQGGGLDNRGVAQELSVTPQTVSKWRGRFVRERLGGLCDAPRSGAPRTVQDADVETVITRTLEAQPKDATHWSTRAMAKQTGLSQSTISRIWGAFGLQPHRQETFKLSSDPLFVAKTRDIVGLYLDPPVKAMVLCVDEKS